MRQVAHVHFLMVAAVAMLVFATSATAQPIEITDTTASTAVVDGTVNAGEYVGFSTGINAGFGDVIGANSQLHVDSDALGSLNFGLVTGAGGLFDRIVIYVDVAPGGFADTSNFTDIGDGLRAAISATGFNNDQGRADIFFAPGFEADYAIGLDSGFAGLWELVANGSHNFVGGAAPANVTANHWEFSFLLSDLGLTEGSAFHYVATYGNPFDGSGFFRSDEFQGVAASTVPAGNIGIASTTLAVGDFNTFNTFSTAVSSEGSSWSEVKALYE